MAGPPDEHQAADDSNLILYIRELVNLYARQSKLIGDLTRAIAEQQISVSQLTAAVMNNNNQKASDHVL